MSEPSESAPKEASRMQLRLTYLKYHKAVTDFIDAGVGEEFIRRAFSTSEEDPLLPETDPQLLEALMGAVNLALEDALAGIVNPPREVDPGPGEEQP